MHAKLLGFLEITHQLYQRDLLSRPLLTRLADRFVLRCFQHLSIHGVAARPAIITTAHQRPPSIVPLVLDTRSTQSTTHLVDIKQTVSRIFIHYLLLCNVWTIPSSHPMMRDRRLNRVILLTVLSELTVPIL